MATHSLARKKCDIVTYEHSPCKLERIRPALGISPTLDLARLSPDMLARITAAKADGTFPRGLCDADLHALVALADEQGAI